LGVEDFQKLERLSAVIPAGCRDLLQGREAAFHGSGTLIHIVPASCRDDESKRGRMQYFKESYGRRDDRLKSIPNVTKP